MSNRKKPIVIELNMMKIAKVNLWLTLILSILFIIANSLIHHRFSATFSF